MPCDRTVRHALCKAVKAIRDIHTGDNRHIIGGKGGAKNRGMAVSSHRPFKAKPVSGICQASPRNRESFESQPDWWPERPKSLSDLRKTTPGVEIWVGAKGGRDQIWPKPRKSRDGDLDI